MYVSFWGGGVFFIFFYFSFCCFNFYFIFCGRGGGGLALFFVRSLGMFSADVSPERY